MALMNLEYDRKERLVAVTGDQNRGTEVVKGDEKQEQIKLAGEMSLKESAGTKEAPEPRVFPGTPSGAAPTV